MSVRFPRVSVLMVARNAQATLGECLNSIRAQTFADFEVVLLDDGSKDGTVEIAAAEARRDRRIRLYRRDRRGLVNALNEGTWLSRAPYIARMDADDIMRPERLALQFSFLRNHPRVGGVAAKVRAFPETKVGGGMRRYLAWQNACVSARDVAEEIFVEATVAQPSVMLRKQCLLDVGGYRDGAFPEDYELWLRLISRGVRIEKIARVLLDWRQTEDSFSKSDARYSRLAFDRIRARYLAHDPRLKGVSLDGRPLVVWGAGRRTRQRCRHLMSYGYSPSYWVDVDPGKIGSYVDGGPVCAPVALASLPRPFVLVYAGAHGAREQITAYLQEHGYARARDYLCVG